MAGIIGKTAPPRDHLLCSALNHKQGGKIFRTGLFLSVLVPMFLFAWSLIATGTSNAASASNATDASVAAKVPENILIFSIDALHPKALSPESSPHIYSLMKKGVYTLEGQSTAHP